jgi:hypothetical protein
LHGNCQELNGLKIVAAANVLDQVVQSNAGFYFISHIEVLVG